MSIDKPNEATAVQLIGHIIIRDPDTGETILRQRDSEKKPADDR
jgi:hypothetical protein